MAERVIKTTLQLDGEKAYKDSLKSINTQLKVASSEMGAVTSSYDKNNASAKDLAAKQEVLNKQIELQKEKQAVLKAAIDDATKALEAAKDKAKEMADAYGEDSEQAQKAADAVRKAEGNLANYEIQANNATKTLNGYENQLEQVKEESKNVGKNTEDMGKKVDKAGDDAANSGGKWEKFKSVTVNAAKAAAAAVGAVTGAVTAVVKATVDAANETAQYGDKIDKSSQKLGVSAEFYQEWDAVLQHSGTSMDAMSATFKKLSTASNDLTATKKTTAAFEQLGLSMDEVSKMSSEDLFETVVGKLQQMEEGTERTAIATTLLGKGAQELGPLLNTSAEDTQAMLDKVNELGGVMSNDAVKASAAYQDSLQDLQTSISGAKNNLVAEFLPSLTKVMDGLTDMFTGKGGMDKINEGISDLVGKVTDALPGVMDAVMSAVQGLIAAVTDNLPAIAETAVNVVIGLADGIVENLPSLTDAALSMILTLVQGLSDGIPQIVEKVPEIIAQIVAQLAAAIPELIEAGTSLISALADGIPDAITAITAALPDIITAILDAIVQAIPELINCGAELLTSLCDSIPIAIDAIVAVLPDIITSIVDTLVDNTPAIIEAGVKLFISLVENLPDAIINIVAAIPQINKAIIEALMKTDWGEVGAQLIEGIADGFADGMWAVTEKIKNVGNGLVEGFKTFFDIHSPSKKMKKLVGYPIGQGIIDGASESVEKTWNKVEKSIESATEKITESTTKSLETMDKSLSETADKDAKSRLDATVKEAETRLAAVKKTLETELADYQKSMEQIQNNISTLAGSMTGKYTDIFTFKKDDDGNIISASTSNKIKQGMKDLDEYTELLDKLRARGMSEDMISQFAGMTVEEGLAVAKYYDGLSDKELSALQTNWEKYNDKATELSTSIYKSKIEDATKSCVAGIQEIFQSEDWSELGKNLVGGIGSGMASEMGELSKTMTDICTGITKQFTDYFGIHSPSRLFADIVGKNLAAGIGVGFDDKMAAVSKSMIDAVPTDFNSPIRRTSDSTAFGGAYGGVIFNQYNTSPKALNRREIRNNTMQQVQLATAVLK